MRKNVFFGSDIFRQSVYGAGHPLNIARVWPVINICKFQGWLDVDEYHDISPASPALLSQFHTADYIQALCDAESEQQLSDTRKARYNIGQSGNPIFPEIYRRPATAAHASFMGAQWLVEGKAHRVFNPSGGTHHGRRDQAYGFCFVNDPAIAIEAIRHKTNAPICYIDIDAHHCDGVQDWHRDTANLHIFSIHQEGLWPRTGLPQDNGSGNATNFTLPAGAGDKMLLEVIENQIRPHLKLLKPTYLIIQAGADGHKDDPQSKLCYHLQGYWQAIDMLLSLELPTMVLGGGGYNPFITAKAWAGIWALIKGVDPMHAAVNEASHSLLKELSWHHRLGRTPPQHWFDKFGDHP